MKCNCDERLHELSFACKTNPSERIYNSAVQWYPAHIRHLDDLTSDPDHENIARMWMKSKVWHSCRRYILTNHHLWYGNCLQWAHHRWGINDTIKWYLSQIRDEVTSRWLKGQKYHMGLDDANWHTIIYAWDTESPGSRCIRCNCGNGGCYMAGMRGNTMMFCKARTVTTASREDALVPGNVHRVPRASKHEIHKITHVEMELRAPHDCW